MSPTYRCLVVLNDPTDDARRLGGWLAAAGLQLETTRPYAGDPLPTALDGYAALLVLGGAQRAYPGPDGAPEEAWFPKLESLLRKAVRAAMPTLGICLGAQLLAVAHGGLVQPAGAGPEIGARLVARRDAADRDPVFAPLPMLQDVVQWHHDEVTELPAGAVLLASSTDHPHQAFSVGGRAWGLQYHIECDLNMIAHWVSTNGPMLDRLDLTAEGVLAGAAAVLDHMAEIWQPFAHRFAATARGELAVGRPLPMLGQ